MKKLIVSLLCYFFMPLSAYYELQDVDPRANYDLQYIPPMKDNFFLAVEMYGHVYEVTQIKHCHDCPCQKIDKKGNDYGNK